MLFLYKLLTGQGVENNEAGYKKESSELFLVQSQL